MLATSLEDPTRGVDSKSSRALSPQPVQASPVSVPGSVTLAEAQSHSEPISQIRPHPERIARK